MPSVVMGRSRARKSFPILKATKPRTRIATFHELPPPEAALEPAQEAELGRAFASLLVPSPGGPTGNGREITVAVHAFDPAAFRDVARVTTNTASAVSLGAIFAAIHDPIIVLGFFAVTGILILGMFTWFDIRQHQIKDAAVDKVNALVPLASGS